MTVLGLTYAFAFLSLALQVKPLLGKNGLTPAVEYLKRIKQHFPDKKKALWNVPTLFWFKINDKLLVTGAWIGFALSLAVTFGLANAIILFVLWALYLSYVQIGQVWYGYGWESQLLETGFAALFLVPLINPLPFPDFAPPLAAILIMWWLTIRLHLGSGLIKLRGDSAWRDLTALNYHFETQPIPNPLSPFFHHLPNAVLKAGTFLTHVVQVIVPIFILAPQPIRNIAGLILIGFQLTLMLSGNLSFLNLVSIVPIIAVVNDSFWQLILPESLVQAAQTAASQAYHNPYPSIAFAAVVAYLSIPVVKNLFSKRQSMNQSFNQFHLVNTYGAFGSVTKKRHELVIQGTRDKEIDADTQWRTYEFPAKPTDPSRRLPIIAPYQPRIDWQLWFAAFQPPRHNPWLFTFLKKLLQNDEHATKLLRKNPFEDQPPTTVRVQYYQYHLNKPFSDQPWSRTHKGAYLPPMQKHELERLGA